MNWWLVQNVSKPSNPWQLESTTGEPFQPWVRRKLCKQDACTCHAHCGCVNKPLRQIWNSFKKPRCSPPSAAANTIFEGLVFAPVHHQSGPTDRRATSRRVRRGVQEPMQSRREPEFLPPFVWMEIWSEAGQWNKVENYTKLVWNSVKQKEKDGSSRRRRRRRTWRRRRKVSRNLTQPGKKKTSNLHSDCWAPSMCCDDSG